MAVELTDAVTVSLAREALDRGAAVRLRVRGRSMRPTIPDGTTVELHRLDGAPRPGEILAVAVGERLIVHRLVRVDPDGRLVLRGDALARCDPPRPRHELLGRVVAPPARLGLRDLLTTARVALARAVRRAR